MNCEHARRWMVATVAALICTQAASAQTAAKRDTTKAPTATTKPATTTKPSTTTAKPAPTTAKPATTTAKPASTTAKPATTPATAKPATAATPSSRPATTGATRSASRTAPAPIGKPTPFDEGGTSLYGGMAMPSLSFNAGPSGGLALRKPILAPPLAMRADLAGSYHSQPTTVSGVQAATLIHVGASAGLELTLRRGPGVRPYIGGAVGVYRFQASGAAGKAAINAGDVFASTTDVAGIATIGLRFSSRFFVEGRYITVGDFSSMPISVGVRF